MSNYDYKDRYLKDDIYNLDDFLPDGRKDGYYNMADFYPPPSSKYNMSVDKETEVYFSDKVQKFILENIYDSLEWYIFGYGTKKVEDDLITFKVEEYTLPLQMRTAASVKVDSSFKTLEHFEMGKKFPDLEYVGLIHSHHNMHAFFSTTDNEDIDDFKSLCPEAGFSIVFAQPSKKYTKSFSGEMTLSSLSFDVKVWEDAKFTSGSMVLCHGIVELDYSTNEMLVLNDVEIEEAVTYKRVLRCRKILEEHLDTPHMQQLNKRQLEALLWAVNMTSAERDNLALVLRTGKWKEEGTEEEE